MLDSNSIGYSDRLVRVLRIQRDLFRQLLRLSEAQSGLIVGEDPDQLIRLLTARDKLISQLQILNREVAAVQDDWPRISSRIPPVCAAQVDEMLAEISDMAGKIVANDESDQRSLSARMAVSRGQVESAGVGRQAHASYRDGMTMSNLTLLDARS
jgi:hypothetical protein